MKLKKKLVAERQSHDNIWREGGLVNVDDTHYNQNKSKRQTQPAAKQMLQESKPFMLVAEHGKPTQEHRTFMAVAEHGRPFLSSITSSASAQTDSLVGPLAKTNMVVKEHAQPYERKSFPCHDIHKMTRKEGNRRLFL